MRIAIFKIISIVDSSRLLSDWCMGQTGRWYSRRPVPSLWWKQVGARPLHADLIIAFVYNLEGEGALGFLRISLIGNHALCLPNPLSPFLNNLGSAGWFQPGVTDLGRNGIVFGDFLTSCCELWSVPVGWGRSPKAEAGPAWAAGAQQGWEQDRAGLGWLRGTGWRSHRKQGANHCSQINLLFFLNLPPRAEVARRRWVHGAGTSVSATKQLLTALEPPLVPSNASWKALPSLCPSDFLLLLLCNCQALHRAVDKARGTTVLVRDFLVCGSAILFF